MTDDLARRRAARALTTNERGSYSVGIYPESHEVALDFDSIEGHKPIRLAFSPGLTREIAHYLILQAERIDALEAGRPDPWPTDPNLPAEAT